MFEVVLPYLMSKMEDVFRHAVLILCSYSDRIVTDVMILLVVVLPDITTLHILFFWKMKMIIFLYINTKKLIFVIFGPILLNGVTISPWM